MTGSARYTSGRLIRVIASGFIFARIVAARFIGRGIAILQSAESRRARSRSELSRSRATPSLRIRCTVGSNCRLQWRTTGRTDLYKDRARSCSETSKLKHRRLGGGPFQNSRFLHSRSTALDPSAVVPFRSQKAGPCPRLCENTRSGILPGGDPGGPG